jgi:GNAT superfamily N-acetyltransferase
VVERGHVGFFDMLTVPAMRRRGLGHKIMETLFAWARDRGAEEGTLQVVEANSAARALYGSFGFRTLYGYRYRVRDPLY